MVSKSAYRCGKEAEATTCRSGMVSVIKVARKVHLVLGVASGMVVFVLAVTGCLYVFEKEITHFLRKDDIIIQPEPKESIALSRLWEQTQN